MGCYSVYLTIFPFPLPLTPIPIPLLLLISYLPSSLHCYDGARDCFCPSPAYPFTWSLASSLSLIQQDMAPHLRLNRWCGILRHIKDQFTGVGTGTGASTGTPMGTSASPMQESAVCWFISGGLYGAATGHWPASCGTLRLQPPRYNDSQTAMQPLTYVYKFQQVLCKHNTQALVRLVVCTPAKVCLAA